MSACPDDLRDALDRIEALEDAIREADKCLSISEGVGLLYYMDKTDQFGQLIAEVIGYSD